MKLFWGIVICSCATAQALQLLAPSLHDPASKDDWVASPCFLCEGYYQQPPLPFPDASKAFLENQALHINADQGSFASEGVSEMKGHVHLTKGNRQLFADRALIHRDPKRKTPLYLIEAFGRVRITEPGLRVDGTSAKLWPESQQKIMDHAQYRFYDRHARGQAEHVQIDQDSQMHLKNASYTTCAPSQNTWFVSAKKMDLNKITGRGQATHSTLYIHNKPVFYLPYFDFPIDDRRQTGFLYPSMGHNNRSGFDASLPFYWNMAPHYDALITPHWFTERGPGAEGLFRYLLPQGQTDLKAFWVPHDRAARQFRQNKLQNHPRMANTDPRVIGLQKKPYRGAVHFKQNLRFNHQWHSNIHYERVHDSNHFVDFGDTLGIVSQSQLQQEARLSYSDPTWSVHTRMQQYQTLYPFEGPQNQSVYRRLPHIAAQNQLDLPAGVVWQFNSDFTQFSHQLDPYTQTPFTTGQRLTARPALSLPMMKPWGSLTPKIQWHALSYQLKPGINNPTTQKYPTLMLPLFSVDSNLIFERPLQFKESNYMQTLEPRAYYLWVPFKDQSDFPNFDSGYSGFSSNQLYWDNRFTGLDRVSDAHQLTLSLGSRFFKRETGLEKLNLNLGQINYFKSPRVYSCAATNIICLEQQLIPQNQKHSAYVGNISYAIQEDWHLKWDQEWDPYQKHNNKKGLSMQYQPEPLAIINVGYQFLRKNIAQINPQTSMLDRLKQTDTSVAWPFNERWRLLGRWHYDIEHHRSNEISMGIEQQGCCTAVRLLATRFIRPFDITQSDAKKQVNNAIFVQFMFKGLGGVGHNSLYQNLKRAIPNYQPWSDRDF